MYIDIYIYVVIDGKYSHEYIIAYYIYLKIICDIIPKFLASVASVG